MSNRLVCRFLFAAIITALAAGMVPSSASWVEAAPSGGMTKGAFVQRYFLDKFKRPPAARKYAPKEAEKLSPTERYQAVVKALAQKGVMALLGSKPDQPLSRVEFITLTHLLAGGGTGATFAQQKEYLKSRGVLDKLDIGHIKAFQGNITVTRDGKKEAIKLTGSEPVLFRDLDETDFGARLELQLDDGSVLTIGEDTALKIDEMVYDPKTKRRSVSLRVTVGTIRVKVSKNTAPGSKFQVITPTTVAGVRGTEFAVTVDEQGKTRIITLEGAVAVRPVGKQERRPTSKAEQKKGAPPEQGTEEGPQDGEAQEEVLVKAGESTEVTAETTTVVTETASTEEIQEVTEATEVTEPTQTASVTTADTEATDNVVEVETTESSTDTVDTNQETSEQTETAAVEEDLGTATQEVTSTGSVDGSLTTSTTPTNGAGELTGLTGALLKSTFLALTDQQQADQFGTLTASQQVDLLKQLTRLESEALLGRFKRKTGETSLTTAVLDSLLDFGFAASAKQVGFIFDNLTARQAAAFERCDSTVRQCLGENGKEIFLTSTKENFTTFGLGVLNSLNEELDRLSFASSITDPFDGQPESYILASADSQNTLTNATNFSVADEILVNLENLPDNFAATDQDIIDIFGGGFRPAVYSVNGGYQAGVLRSTSGGGDGVALIDVSSRIAALNNNGFLAYAVQVEEDILNSATLVIRGLASGTYAAGNLNALVDSQLDLSSIRARDGLLAAQADARAGVVLQSPGGERIRVQQYIFRPPSNSDEVRMISISLGSESLDLSYLDTRVAFQSGSLSGKSALQIRALQWSDYFTLGYTDTLSNCLSSTCTPAVVSPGSGQPLLDTLSVEMGNGNGDYIREKITLENATSGLTLYDFDGVSRGALNVQKATLLQLTTRQAGLSAKSFTVGTGSGPILYKPQDGSTLSGAGVPTGEYRVVPRSNVSGAAAPASGRPDGFNYIVSDSGTTRSIEIRFAVVGDATTTSKVGLQTGTCGSGGGTNCGTLAFDNIWAALGVNHPTSSQGLNLENIGANVLEITANPTTNITSGSIRNYLIPWRRMVWLGETNQLPQ